MKKQYIYFAIIIMAFGAILMLGSPKKTAEKRQTAEEQAIDNCEKLSQLLSQVKGAGEVRVLASYPSSNEKVPAYDTKLDTQSDENNGIKSLSEISDKQVAGNEPMILAELYPKPTGVVILAQGADNIEIKAQLIRAAMAYFDIDMNKIEVMTMK